MLKYSGLFFASDSKKEKKKGSTTLARKRISANYNPDPKAQYLFGLTK